MLATILQSDELIMANLNLNKCIQYIRLQKYTIYPHIDKTSTLFYVLFAFIPFSCIEGQIAHNYLSAPVRGKLTLSGTFGELRTNHFHKGIDIRTKKAQGNKNLRRRSRYISKVTVSPWGYGKYIEITHPNGYKTLYAHLDRFNAKIEALVKRKQYQRKRNFLSVYPSRKNFAIKRGALIGYSGNTGSSQAPHLHFELRDANNITYNPLSYGIKSKRRIASLDKNVYIIPLDESTVIKRSDRTLRTLTAPLTKGNLFR